MSQETPEIQTDRSTQRALLAKLRHELRTPMNAIIGYSEMLLEELEEQGDQAFISELRKIHACGTQLLSLVNTIMNPAKLEESQFDLNIAIFGETMRVELQTPLKAVISYCELLLEEAVVALIPDLEKIYTAAQSLSTMINDIVYLSGQQLQGTDAINTTNSTEEDISIPNRDSYTTVAPASNTVTHSRRSDVFDEYENRYNDRQQVIDRGTILVVDDNATNRDLLSRQLERQEYTVAVAANGQQALQMIESRPYDLILLDIIMPAMNGYQVLERLKEDKRWRHIPIIMISALDEIDSIVRCIEMGAEDYLPKPFNPVLLSARVGACLEKKRLRDQEVLYLAQLAQANQEIIALNERLKAENCRLSAELEVTRQLQQMILPQEEELNQIDGLEIAGFMEPAEEVGGDYYDVLQHNGHVKIGIGDVCGHGLESGVLMLMVQTAVRTLLATNETDPTKFLNVINRIIYDNVQRMSSDKILTLSLLDYQEGLLILSGQHEEMIVVRSGGRVERIDTADLGFPIGLEPDIAAFIGQAQVRLKLGDVVVLYTDGITEAQDINGVNYGLDRLCEVTSRNWQRSSSEIRQAVIKDVRQHIGEQKVYDDITLVVFKQK